jgi:hypothetical protein
VRCSLIDEYVKKPSAHGMSTFNGSSIILFPKYGQFMQAFFSFVGYGCTMWRNIYNRNLVREIGALPLLTPKDPNVFLAKTASNQPLLKSR